MLNNIQYVKATISILNTYFNQRAHDSYLQNLIKHSALFDILQKS